MTAYGLAHIVSAQTAPSARERDENAGRRVNQPKPST